MSFPVTSNLFSVVKTKNINHLLLEIKALKHPLPLFCPPPTTTLQIDYFLNF